MCPALNVYCSLLPDLSHRRAAWLPLQRLHLTPGAMSVIVGGINHATSASRRQLREERFRLRVEAAHVCHTGRERRLEHLQNLT